MQLRLARFAIGATFVGALTIPASAQWSEDFDALSAGAILDDVAQFDNWSGVSQPANTVSSTQAFSGANSASIVGGNCGSCSDTIGWLGTQITQIPYSAGQWTLKSMSYVPTGLTNTSYFIVLSSFDAGAVNVNWCVQTHYNPATADITDDGANTNGSGAELIQFDTWTELRYEIDLDLDTLECYYNNVLLFDRPWSPGVFGNNGNAGTPELKAIDLFPLDTSSEVFYDDIRLDLVSGSVGTNQCTAVANSTGVAASIAGTGTAVAADNNVTIHGSDLPPNTFAAVIVADTATFIPAAGGGQGNLCIGPAIGRYNLNSGYAALPTGASGDVQLLLDLTNTPSPAGSVMTVAGNTKYFQIWYRDNNPSTTSNFTDALEVLFL